MTVTNIDVDSNPFAKEITRLKKTVATGSLDERAIELFRTRFRPLLARSTHSTGPAVQQLIDGLELYTDEEINRACIHLIARKDVRAEKIVSDKYGFIWVCNPKVASRSLIESLQRSDPTATLIKGKTLSGVLGEDLSRRNYFKFGFVRNPFARVFSAYEDKIVNINDPRKRAIFYDRMFGIREGMSFREFLQWLNGPFGEPSISDRHFLPQIDHFVDDDGAFVVDYVGKAEDIESALLDVSRCTGIPRLRLPFLNTSVGYRAEQVGFESSRERYIGQYDEECISLVKEKYKADFEKFSYSCKLGL